MRKSYKLDGLCCANCANKIEEGINKLEGVSSARVMFMSEKLVMEYAEGADVNAVLDSAQKVCTKYEDDCVILR